MPKRSPPPPPAQANLTADEMRRAIPKIEARIRDLDAFDVSKIQDRSDPSINALEAKLTTTLAAIFPPRTHEHNLYLRENTNQINTAPYTMRPDFPGMRGDYSNPQKDQEGLRAGIAKARSMWVTMKETFEEELGSTAPSSADKAIKAYDGLELHAEVQRAAAALFHDGHYAEAVEKAMKALVAYVKFRSGVNDRDGTDLMQHVFKEKDPILKFNALATESDRSEQRGFMMMFSGAVSALRNPRAHEIIEDAPETALEYIAYISLLAKLTDRAEL